MTSSKNLFVSALLAFAALAPGLAKADYSAVAYGSDGSGMWATKKTQAEANQAALKMCNEGNPKLDCELKFTKGVVLVVNPEDDDFVGYYPALESVEETTARALKECGKPGCKVEKVTVDPGFWAFATSTNKDGGHQTYLTHGYDNFDEARSDAVRRCQELTEYHCERKWSGVIAGEQKPSTSQPKKKK